MSNTPPFAFFGTPFIATRALDALEEHGLVPAVVVTQPDKPTGRKQVLTAPPVKEWAEARTIEVLQPERITPESLAPLYNSEWEYFVVAAYGKILPQALLDVPHFGAFNLHPSLLPKFRGASPVRSAILADAKDAIGVTIIKLDKEMDHGPILAQARVELETWPVRADTIEEMLFYEGGHLLAEALTESVYKQADAYAEQNHAAATYSEKIKKEMGEISFESNPYQNWLKFNALYPWPGIFYFDENGKRIKITEATYNGTSFEPVSVIPEGSKEMPFTVFKNTKM